MFSCAFKPLEVDIISLDTVSPDTRSLEVERFFCKFEHLETQSSLGSCSAWQFSKESQMRICQYSFNYISIAILWK